VLVPLVALLLNEYLIQPQSAHSTLSYIPNRLTLQWDTWTAQLMSCLVEAFPLAERTCFQQGTVLPIDEGQNLMGRASILCQEDFLTLQREETKPIECRLRIHAVATEQSIHTSGTSLPTGPLPNRRRHLPVCRESAPLLLGKQPAQCLSISIKSIAGAHKSAFAFGKCRALSGYKRGQFLIGQSGELILRRKLW
jgi:hypothetical protein